MARLIKVGEIAIEVNRKNIKHAHLSVHPPFGRVTLVVPVATRPEVARAFAISKLAWIRRHQSRFAEQAREPARQFVERESHYIWGRRYLFSVVEKNEKPSVRLDHKRITLAVRPGSTKRKRGDILREWHRSLLHTALPPLIQKWERKLGVTVSRYFLQRMKTKWGSCNHGAGNIRLNTELVKKPKDLLEYVIVHEMLHLRERTHSERFLSLLQAYYPAWREARDELNDLPLGAEQWGGQGSGD